MTSYVKFHKIRLSGSCRQYGDKYEKLFSLKLTVRGDSHSSKTAILARTHDKTQVIKTSWRVQATSYSISSVWMLVEMTHLTEFEYYFASALYKTEIIG